MTSSEDSTAVNTSAAPTLVEEDQGEVPFYKTVKRSFKDVDMEGGVDTAQFCEADDAVIAFFDLFTNAPFAIVRKDLFSKITKVRERLALHPETSRTLEDILEDERKTGVRVCTGELTWLLRSLRFTCLGMRMNMQNDREEVSVSMTRAYGETLRPFHGMMIRPIFALAMKAVPYRSTFYKHLGEPHDVVMVELDDWLSGLEKVLERMEDVYATGKYGELKK